MKIQFNPSVPSRRLIQVRLRTPEEPARDGLDANRPSTLRSLNRERIMAAVETSAVGGCLGALASYGIDSGLCASLGLGTVGLVAGAVAGIGLASKFSSQGDLGRSGLLAAALGGLVGSAVGAVAGSGLVSPAVRLAVLVALGAGAGLVKASAE